MNSDFSRIITLLRKERGISQKQVANDLEISQALLSHYEKGIRECGLDFVVKVADYYGVSCDYLLGRAPERTGTTITINEIPDADSAGKENMFRGSLLPTLNKKLIANSLNIIFDTLQNIGNKELTVEVSSYLMTSVYKMFRALYSANAKNPQGMFSVPEYKEQALSSALQLFNEANVKIITCGITDDDLKGIDRNSAPEITPEILSKQYPLFATSLYNLLQTTENKMLQLTGKAPTHKHISGTKK